MPDSNGRLSLFAALAGALAASGQAPVNFGPLTLAGLAGAAMVFAHARTARQAMWLGWVVGAGYFALALNWIVEPFLVDIARHGWMAPFALVLMAGGLALFWAAAFGAAHMLATVWALPATLALAELARAYLFTGFPWAMPSYAYVNGIAAQAAAWIGPHGVNLLLFALATAIARALPRWRGWGFAVLGLALALPLPSPEVSQGAVVRLVQPNAAQHEKWDQAHMDRFWKRAISATAQPGNPALIVWPETSVPVLHEYATPYYEAISIASNGSPVVVGTQRRDSAGFYNSLAVIEEGGSVTQIYDKHLLVPFGEYLPFDALLRRFGLFGLAADEAGGYRAGPGPHLITVGSLGTALPLICYEAVFPHYPNALNERPDMILHITNDAWFGRWAGPDQHLAQARMRAIEQGLPLLRSANTGISAIIDARGRITASLPLGRAGHVDAPLPNALLRPTLYSRTGDLAVLIFVLLTLFHIWLRRRDK